MNNLKALDFFCSAGGVTCGLKSAGINVVGGIDIDSSCKETYEKNNDAKFLTADVSNLEKEAVADFFNITKNDDDLIFVGCSPCQYYSNINTNKSKSTKTRLLLEDFQEFVEYYKPGYVFIENVPGLEKKVDSPILEFKKFLKESGYIFDDGILNAKYFGVAQNRRRYMLLATRVADSISLPNYNKNEVKSIREVIGDEKLFPPIEAGVKDTSSFIHSSAQLTKLNLERIKSTDHDGGDRRNWPEKLKLECYKTHNGHYDVYGRMTWNKPAPTITTRFVSYSNGRYGHPEQNRAISLREGATIQSFPIDYIFHSSSQGKIAQMIGNAVPPEMAKKIGLQIIESLNKDNGKI